MGSVVDLTSPGVRAPSTVAVDTNVIVARLLSSYTGQDPQAPLRAARFFRSLIASNGVGIVTPTTFGEVIHVAIRVKYERDLSTHHAVLAARYGQRRRYLWSHLYKIDPTILQRYAGVLDQLRQRFQANNLLILRHEDLGPVPSGHTYDHEIVQRIGRYGLDVADSTILLEAERAGVLDIVTLDSDMQRARADFNIYTWL